MLYLYTKLYSGQGPCLHEVLHDPNICPGLATYELPTFVLGATRPSVNSVYFC